MVLLADDILCEVMSFLSRHEVTGMASLNSKMQRIARFHVKTMHVLSELLIQPCNEEYGSVQAEQLCIHGTILDSTCQVPNYILFKQVTICCGVTLVHQSTWSFLHRNLPAFDGCILAFGRICDALRSLFDKVFGLFAKCSCICLPYTCRGPAWDRELLGHECWNADQFYQHEAVLNCDHLDIAFTHGDKLSQWIIFGGRMNRPRRLTYRRYPLSIVYPILKSVVDWCEQNQMDINFTMHQHPTPKQVSRLRYDIIKRPRKEWELGIENVGPGCPKNCFQGVLRRLFAYNPNHDFRHHYEIVNFKHEICMFVNAEQ